MYGLARLFPAPESTLTDDFSVKPYPSSRSGYRPSLHGFFSELDQSLDAVNVNNPVNKTNSVNRKVNKGPA